MGGGAVTDGAMAGGPASRDRPGRAKKEVKYFAESDVGEVDEEDDDDLFYWSSACFLSLRPQTFVHYLVHFLFITGDVGWFFYV